MVCIANPRRRGESLANSVVDNISFALRAPHASGTVATLVPVHRFKPITNLEITFALIFERRSKKCIT